MGDAVGKAPLLITLSLDMEEMELMQSPLLFDELLFSVTGTKPDGCCTFAAVSLSLRQLRFCCSGDDMGQYGANGVGLGDLLLL